MASNQEGLSGEHIVCVFPNESAARAAADDVQSKDHGPVSVFSGDELSETSDAMGDRGGPLTKLVRHVQDALSEEQRILAQYENEARNGRGILAVHVENQEEAHLLRDLLLEQGAQNIRYFSRMAVNDLSPETNPSSMAEAPSDQ